uniref:Pco064740 n=1 Tax=Arundo donax TaxID=35708 RepID=A0A0A9F4A6_ARUDO
MSDYIFQNRRIQANPEVHLVFASVVHGSSVSFSILFMTWFIVAGVHQISFYAAKEAIASISS